MKLDVEITRISDGAVRVYHDDFDWQDVDLAIFQWGENNYACDCNRHLFFERAAGREPPDTEGPPCGDTLYHVKLMDAHGTVLYEDSRLP